MYIVRGNVVDALLNKEIDFLLHCCNAQGKYASGIAGEIRQKIPTAYNVYMNSINTIPESKCLGTISVEKGVVNIIGQKYYGYAGMRYVNYGALAKAFNDLFYVVQDYSLKQPKDISIGIPHLIGHGLAGGDKLVIMELIEHCLCSWCDNVILYKI